MAYARTVQRRGVEMGEHSQHEDFGLEEHVHDRNVASIPREKEVWPEWALEGLE